MRQASKLLLFALAFIGALAPLGASLADVNVPTELAVQDAKDRSSYDRALTQLNDLMKQKQQVANYEDTVDKFVIYKDKISRQEIGATLFNMYSKVGPRPGSKYFGDRAIAAEKAAADAAALKAQQDAQAAQQKAAAAANSSRTYVNSSGNTVQSPTYSSSAPAGATAQCRDGAYSFSQHRSGTCSSHGGVAQWLQ